MKYYGIRFFSAFVLFSLVFSTMNCRHSPDESDYPQMCFERDILPVFLNNCALSGCHDGTREYRLTGYSDIMRLVSPGNPDNSEIYKAITGSGEEMMPPGRPLSLENRTKIRMWIGQGATPSSCP